MKWKVFLPFLFIRAKSKNRNLTGRETTAFMPRILKRRYIQKIKKLKQKFEGLILIHNKNRIRKKIVWEHPEPHFLKNTV